MVALLGGTGQYSHLVGHLCVCWGSDFLRGSWPAHPSAPAALLHPPSPVHLSPGGPLASPHIHHSLPREMALVCPLSLSLLLRTRLLQCSPRNCFGDFQIFHFIFSCTWYKT